MHGYPYNYKNTRNLLLVQTSTVRVAEEEKNGYGIR